MTRGEQVGWFLIGVAVGWMPFSAVLIWHCCREASDQ